MADLHAIPWRGRTDDRPRFGFPLPGAPMPLLRGGRPLKRWRWVGCFGPELMLYAASAQVGPGRISWWAVCIVSSRYEQPFGRFDGTLPGAGRLRHGWGVMERHEARW